MEPIRLGIIGAGLAVRLLHWPALRRLTDRYKIVQVCDNDQAAARETAALLGGAPITSDYHQVLLDPQVEAVLISLPIHLNAQVTLEAAHAGKHVLCEKPLAGSLEAARDLVQALAGVGVVVAIAENHHFHPELLAARDWIRAGRIGTPFLVAVEGIYWSDTSQGFSGTPWRHDAQYRGAVVADSTVHHFAGLRELAGEVEQIQAFYKDVHPAIAGPDTLICNLRFRNGMLGQVLFSGAAKAAGGEFARYRVYGSEGAITVDREGAKLLRPAGESDNASEVQETVSRPLEEKGGYYEEFADFYAAVREGRNPRVTPAEALRDFELVMYALDSAEERKIILL